MPADDETKAYIEKHNVGGLVEQLLQHLGKHRPDDPLVGIADWAAKQSLQQRMQISKRRGTQLDHNMALDIYQDNAVLNKAVGIICTIGPVSQPVEELKELINAGMSVSRMNFSHGDHAFHGSTIANTRQAAKELGVTVALALDTKGPEIRTGNIENGGTLDLPTGHALKLSTDEQYKEKGSLEVLYVDYKNITKVMNVGQQVFIDDGLLALEIREIGDDFLNTVVVNPSIIASKRGVNLPHVVVDLPAVSEKDKADLKFAAEQGVDMIFASFIRKASQVKEVRQCLEENGGHDIKVIAKIENHEGIQNFDQILDEADGVMVARGDLGTEIPIEKVFVAQKMMVSKCNVKGKPCIVATQMLESMTNNPRPTRAEANDVANAVLDGADMVMLSGETAKGSFRKECVTMMNKITVEAQAANREENLFDSIKGLRKIPISIAETIACGAVNSAFELQAKAIIAVTSTGNTARMMSKYRAPCPIIAVTTEERTARQLLLHRFVKPLLVEKNELTASEADREEKVKLATDFAIKTGLAQSGDKLIVVHAGPNVAHRKGFANQTRVVVVA
eukprot:TRINITY_DN7396_c4_g1_i1.p1 TRINITY_DN7396_c4_g1~~TRINITY_DN7396_c4_g1_i1.p1  ORF type:complete len:564 (+),score=184.50 TRINITY_DN7396_c4_g1_i1:37-1728(+)